MDIVKQPHDRFFKEVFSNPEVMKDFITNYLPPEIATLIDINTLTLENNSFIDPELKENQSDLLFKTSIRQKESYLIYIISARSDLELKDIHEAAKNISPERSADIMTIAEKLYKEGMEKGMEKGRLEGMLETKRKTAKNFLRQGLSPEQIAEATELPLNEVLQLKKELDN